MTEHLDAFERAQLTRAEKTIRKGLRTFVQVGEALLTIRDARLYRETHPTFEDYCRDRWQLSKTHANRLAQAAEVVAALPDGPLPTSERQARELAPLRDDPGALRRVWDAVVHRTGGKPTAKAIREAVHETIPHQTPAGPDAHAPDRAEAGAPAEPMRGEPAGDTRSTESPATLPAGQGGTGAQEGKPAAGPARTDPPAAAATAPGEGGGPAGGDGTGRSVSGGPGNAARPRPGAPTPPLPDPQPVSPSRGPESGGQAAPSSSSQVDGADASPPSAHPVAEGGEPVLTAAEIDEALGDQWSPHFLEGEGCRLALARINQGEPVDRAVARAVRLTCRPGRLPEHAKAVAS